MKSSEFARGTGHGANRRALHSAPRRYWMAGYEWSVSRRSSLLLSPAAFNKQGLAFVCPVTNQAKGHPFEVPLPPACGTTGVVLVWHLRSLDWRARSFTKKGAAPDEVVDKVLGMVRGLLT